MGYVVAHEERMGRTVAATNPDMVGEDLELCRTSFGLRLTPGAMPSCEEAAARARREMIQVAGGCIRRLQEEAPQSVLRQAAERLAFLADRQGRAVASALRFADDAGVLTKIGRLQGALKAAVDVSWATGWLHPRSAPQHACRWKNRSWTNCTSERPR